MKEKIVANLKKLSIDAYVVYDFRGSNFVARQVLGFKEMTTRRWVAIFTASGKVTYIIPKIESIIFENIDGEKKVYGSYDDFFRLLAESLKDLKTIALEYTPTNDIPVQDIVPSGFVEAVRKVKPDINIVSSADLTQYISALWGEAGLKAHLEATNDITEIKDLAYDFIEKSLKDGKKITDYDGRMFIINEFHKRNIYTEDDICIVSTNARAGNPHYWPTLERNFVIEPNSVLLFDIWGKKKVANAVYSDSTFMAWIGPDPIPNDFQKLWDIVRKARDIGIETVMNNINNDLRGYQVDRAVRDYIISEGYGDNFVHRTGHSIDINEHGSGADMDDFEKKDTRKVLPDCGFSIEPGIYLPHLGMRSEINMYVDKDNKPKVTTFKQEDLKIINS